MSKKCECPPAGAPDWVLTYGDMMSLLLCFFILLAAFSELKKPRQFQEAVHEIQTAFGMDVARGKMSFIERTSDMHQTNPNLSTSEDEGMTGRQTTVTKVRDGWEFTQGGRITFEPGSAELTLEAQDRLRQVAAQIRGLTTKVDLAGHAAPRELVDTSEHLDLWALSYARAKAVMDFLTRDDVGIDPARIRLVANADREPLVTRAYSSREQEPNRRVSVVVRDVLVDQFVQPESR